VSGCERRRERHVGKGFARATLAAAALAFAVIVLGAYVRLSDAGLACPDWPGCYGRLIVPDPESASDLGDGFARPLDAPRAWKEMLHRYLAGALGLVIAALALAAWRRRRERSPVLPLALLALVVFQALLGMWTVTLLLKPVVVVAHLLGGMATLALLGWWALGERLDGRASAAPPVAGGPRIAPWAALAVAVVFVQIALGGWTSANYAAFVCQDFPRCQGEWWPPMDFGEGFRPWRGLGVDYEGGVLDHAARTAIQVSHRIGALVTFAYLAWLGARALAAGGPLRAVALLMLVALVAQIALGIAVATLIRPLAFAVAHNAAAALLLLAVVACLRVARARERPPVKAR